MRVWTNGLPKVVVGLPHVVSVCDEGIHNVVDESEDLF